MAESHVTRPTMCRESPAPLNLAQVRTGIVDILDEVRTLGYGLAVEPLAFTAA
jgi:hypothetical protein